MNQHKRILHMLGEPEVFGRDGAWIPIRQRKTNKVIDRFVLLFYLAYRRRETPRHELRTMMWGETADPTRDEKDPAVNRLNVALHHLRATELDSHPPDYEFMHLQDRRGQADATHLMGMISTDFGDHRNAEKCYLDAMRIYSELKYRRGSAECLLSLGILGRWGTSSPEEAFANLSRSQQIFESLGDIYKNGIALLNMGFLKREMKDFRMAGELILQATQIRSRQQDQRGIAYSLHNAGYLAADMRQPQIAVVLMASAAGLRAAIRTPLPIDEQRYFDRYQQELTAQLGANFRMHWAEGARMSAADAVNAAFAFLSDTRSLSNKT